MVRGTVGRIDGTRNDDFKGIPLEKEVELKFKGSIFSFFSSALLTSSNSLSTENELWMPAAVFIIVFHLFSEMLQYLLWWFSAATLRPVSHSRPGFLDANIFSRSAQPSGARSRFLLFVVVVVKPVAGCFLEEFLHQQRTFVWAV